MRKAPISELISEYEQDIKDSKANLYLELKRLNELDVLSPINQSLFDTLKKDHHIKQVFHLDFINS
jgi:hypothetical protein